MMKDIKWEDGAVCFIDGKQYKSDVSNCIDINYVLEGRGFQLNEIQQGACISVSELDTEQKYNDAVEVFELFGFTCSIGHGTFRAYGNLYAGTESAMQACNERYVEVKGKITYSQLMAIGKLKRVILIRDAEKQFAETGSIPTDLVKRHTITWPDNFYPKDGTHTLDGVDVYVKWGVNETVCGKPKTDFVKAIDRVNELESEPPLDTSSFNTLGESRQKRGKSKQAYALLESLNYGYDEDKQQWYQKVYV